MINPGDIVTCLKIGNRKPLDLKVVSFVLSVKSPKSCVAEFEHYPNHKPYNQNRILVANFQNGSFLYFNESDLRKIN